MKINRKFFINTTVYLLALRNPLIIITMITYIMTDKLLPKKLLVNLISFLCLLLVMVIYSISMGNEIGNIFGQARDILLCLLVFCFLLVASGHENVNNKTIYSALKKCFVFVGCVKIIIIAYTAKTGIAVSDVIDWIRDTWNIQMMSLGVKDSVIFRLQIPLDSVVPFFLYFVIKEFINDKSSRKLSGISILILIISMLLTLSRAFWAETLFFIFSCLVIETSLLFKMKTFFYLIVSSFFLFFLMPIGGGVSNIFKTRFGDSNSANTSSDAERVWQNNALYSSFMDDPILGHGLGYYIPNAIRSTTTKYLYESQTLSMMMDIGILGCLALLLLISYHIMINIKKDNGVFKDYTMGAFFIIFWLVSGSVNPLLFGASGGVILFMAAKITSLYRI